MMCCDSREIQDIPGMLELLCSEEVVVAAAAALEEGPMWLLHPVDRAQTTKWRTQTIPDLKVSRAFWAKSDLYHLLESSNYKGVKYIYNR